MRIVCHIFLISLILFEIQNSAGGNEKNTNGAIVDMKLVEFDDEEIDESEAGKPMKKKEHTMGVKNFVGTNLFVDSNGFRKNCFSSEDVALLAARRDFESLMPKDLPNCLLDDDLAKVLLHYFYGASQVIDKMTRGHSKFLIQKAFYDTLGGYFKYYMIPISKYSFYGGLVKLRTVQSILELFSQSKKFLNTNGNGWRDPLKDFSEFNIQIEPLRIVINNKNEDTSCTQLEMLDERAGEDNDIIVALPRLDPEENGLLRNIWLPFKRKRTFDLQSSRSAFVFLRYFELTTKCYKFQSISQELFNKRFKNWIFENLEVHLKDDVLYPGLGGMLRIIETLRRKPNSLFITEVKTFEKHKRKQNLAKHTQSKQIASSENSLENIFESKNPPVSDTFMNEVLNNKEEDCQRRKFIYIAIAISVCVVITVFLAIGLTFCKKSFYLRSKHEEKPLESKKTGWFGCRKKPKDGEEEILFSKNSSGKPNSKKISSKKNRKSSDVHDPESTTCCSTCWNKNTPAIIETSSMDSDSGREKKSSPFKSKPTKTMIVNEKKRVSISKKNINKNGENRSQSVKVGILKKGI